MAGIKVFGLTFGKDGKLETRTTSVDWRTRAVAQGYGGHVTIGTLSAPITGGGAGTVYDPEQPEGLVSVDREFTLVPLRVTVQCQVPLLATDTDECEIKLAADVLSAWPVTGTRTDEAIFNMLTTGRTPVAGTSEVPGIVAASAFTVDTTTPVLGMDLDGSVITGDVQGTPASALWTPLALLYEPVTPPLIRGPACMYLYWGGTVAVTGFAQIEVLSIPNDVLKALL